jgi:hypothetical protein
MDELHLLMVPPAFHHRPVHFRSAMARQAIR